MYLQLGGTTSMALSGSGLEVKGKLAVGYSDFTNIPANGAAFLGSVGIGTNAPESKLAVKGASGDNDLFSISDIAVPTSGAEYGVMMIKSASEDYLLNLTSYSANGRGARIYHNGGTASRYGFLVTSGAGTNFIVDGIGNVGIANTNPQARLQVEELGIDTTATTLGIGTGATAVYSVGTTLFRTMELMIQITQGSNYHAVKLFVLHNGTDVWFNQTNVLHTAAELGTFSMDISSGNVRAIYTPTSTAVASTVKVAAMKIAV
jgi:hypothetical protein